MVYASYESHNVKYILLFVGVISTFYGYSMFWEGNNMILQEFSFYILIISYSFINFIRIYLIGLEK